MSKARHACAVPRCEVAIGRRYLMCRPHWFKVPGKLRDRVWRTYLRKSRGDTTALREYVEARREAVASVTKG